MVKNIRHVNQWTTISLNERFFQRVEKKDNGCWLWKGAKDGKFGYGNFLYKGKLHRAHRISWLIHSNELPPSSICILHKCDVPLCVNPDHLFLGNRTDNHRDMLQKNRNHKLMHYRGEKNPSAKLTNEQAKEIKEKLKAGIKGRKLAKDYNVCPQTICDINLGRIWKHI